MKVFGSIKTVALPAAGNSASTGAIQVGNGNVGDRVEFLFEYPALPNLVNTKKVTTTFEHSDTEGGSYTAIEGTGNMVITGPASGGSPAKTFGVFIPRRHKAWVRATVAVEAAGGDNTASSLTFAPDL